MMLVLGDVMSVLQPLAWSESDRCHSELRVVRLWSNIEGEGIHGFWELIELPAFDGDFTGVQCGMGLEEAAPVEVAHEAHEAGVVIDEVTGGDGGGAGKKGDAGVGGSAEGDGGGEGAGIQEGAVAGLDLEVIGVIDAGLVEGEAGVAGLVEGAPFWVEIDGIGDGVELYVFMVNRIVICAEDACDKV